MLGPLTAKNFKKKHCFFISERPIIFEIEKGFICVVYCSIPQTKSDQMIQFRLDLAGVNKVRK